MVKLITRYLANSNRYEFVSNDVNEEHLLPKWRVVYNEKSVTPFEVYQADYRYSTYEYYGEYRTLDRVMDIVNNEVVNNTVSNLLPIAEGTTVILQFGIDLSFDIATLADEIVNQIHFNSPTETTFIMEKQSIPIK